MSTYEYIADMIDNFDKCEESIDWSRLEKLLVCKGESPRYGDLEFRQDEEGNIYTLTNTIEINSKQGLCIAPVLYKCKDECLGAIKKYIDVKINK